MPAIQRAERLVSDVRLFAEPSHTAEAHEKVLPFMKVYTLLH